jgi:hypothetical protein
MGPERPPRPGDSLGLLPTFHVHGQWPQESMHRSDTNQSPRFMTLLPI